MWESTVETSSHVRPNGWDKIAARASNAAVPPIAKISMIGIWIETVLYGLNCVMYGLCMFILLRGRSATLRWVLVVMSTIFFLLCTVHVGASLQQLLDAFVYAPDDIPDYSTTYWLDYDTTLVALKDIVYDTLLLAQDFMLIWRLYVVFMGDWRVVIFPIILAAGCVGTVYTTTAVSAVPDVGLYGSVVPDLIISAWVLDMTLNLSVTVAIAGRLWWIDRKLTSLTNTRANRYMASVYVVVESGAISAVTTIVMFALYVTNNPASLSGLDVASQLAALTPLLIVVQIGLTSRYRNPGDDSSRAVLTAQEEISFRVGVPREQDSRQDLSLHMFHSPSSAHDVRV